MAKKQRKETIKKLSFEVINSWRADWNKFVREAFGVNLDPEQQEILSSLRHSPWQRLCRRLCRHIVSLSHAPLEAHKERGRRVG